MPNILIEAPSSDSLIETGFGWKKEKVLELALDATQYAKYQLATLREYQGSIEVPRGDEE